MADRDLYIHCRYGNRSIRLLLKKKKKRKKERRERKINFHLSRARARSDQVNEIDSSFSSFSDSELSRVLLRRCDKKNHSALYAISGRR